MVKQLTISLPDEVNSRFLTIIPPGQRSKLIAQLLTEHLDKYDNVAAGKKLREHYVKTVVASFIKEFSKKYNLHPFKLWDGKVIIKAMKEAGIEAELEDVQSAINFLLKDES